MPCDNISESIAIAIDSEDRLKSYRLYKSSCGVEVGDESLLQDHLRGHTVTEILNFDIEQFARSIAGLNEIDRFLASKHFCAIRLALEALIGMQDGGPNADCRIVDINYDEEGLNFEADIELAKVTGKILACGQCTSGCAANKVIKVSR